LSTFVHSAVLLPENVQPPKVDLKFPEEPSNVCREITVSMDSIWNDGMRSL